MPNIPKLIPPPDLLSQVGGIEQGLRRGQRLRLAGIVAAALQGTILAANSEWLDALVSFKWSAVDNDLWLLIPLFGVILSALVATAVRLWLKESREPFRYTFDIAPFEPMAGATDDPKLAFLSEDLLELISRRIRRLSRYDLGASAPAAADGSEAGAADPEAARQTSHIHISGSYAIRNRPPRPDPILEVTAWIRIGPESAPMNLAHPVKFRLPRGEDAEEGDLPAVDVRDYERIVERVYFSVATEIYRRIKQDVRRKIDLLPRRYFRAVAYFHEAQDYGRSNTLDAYDEAKALYGDALRTYDPTWAAAWSPSRHPRPVLRTRQFVTLALQRSRRALSRVWPRLGRIEVLIARALIGYANALLYRRILAAQLGMNRNPIFEARPLAERALKRLEQVSRRVPDREASRFEVHVTLAFALNQMGADVEAERHLACARGIDPGRADTDPRYLFAAGLLDGRTLGAIRTLRRTVELDGGFEAAQFELAKRHQMVWESRETFEEAVAETVRAEHEKVLALNPGNLAAWSARAHMSWLMGDLADARREYENGREYKEIVRVADVIRIDWGLARVAAESGHFEAAYRHYIDAASALIAQGRSYDEFRYAAAQIDPIDDLVRDRFERYMAAVEAWNEEWAAKPDADESERIRRSVLAFVHSDYGWALQQNFQLTGDEASLREAKKHYLCAREMNRDFVIASYNLYFATLGAGETETEESARWIREVHRREPDWPEANLLMLGLWARDVREAEAAAGRLEARAAQLREQARQEADQVGSALYAPAVAVATNGAAAPDEPGTADLAREPVQAARGHRNSATRAHQDAADCEGRAKDLREEAAALRMKMGEVGPKLLPQEWLWRDGRFDWSVLTGWRKRRGCKRNLIWERSFEDFHARALFQWARAQFRAGEEPRRVQRALETLGRSFWPNDFDLLRAQRAVATRMGCAVHDYDEQIVSVVKRWVRFEGQNFWTLRWLTSDTFVESDLGRRFAADELDRTAQREDLKSSWLYKWLGDSLRQLNDPRGHVKETASSAYERACSLAVHKREYARVVEVGGRIAEMKGDAAADSCFEEALEADDPEVLVEVARWFEARSRWEDAVTAMRGALENDPDPERVPEYRRTYARCLWAVHDYDDALIELMTAEEGAPFEDRWRTHLADEIDTERREARMRLRQWLFPRQHEAAVAGERDDAIDTACALLHATLSRPAPAWECESASGAPDAPLAVPLELVMASRGFGGDNGSAIEHARAHELPAMLDRVRKERGLAPAVAGIRVVDDAADGFFRIALNEVPIEAGVVPPGESEPRAFVLGRLEARLRLHLARFVDSEVVEALLADWETEDLIARTQVRHLVLPDERARRRFVGVVRELVREEVPIRRLGAILVAERPGPLFEDLRRARAAVTEDLPGRDAQIVPLPPAVEEKLRTCWDANDRRTLTLSEELDREIEELLGDELGDGAADANGAGIAIEVATPGLRPYAARVIGRHLPGVPVLASEECP